MLFLSNLVKQQKQQQDKFAGEQNTTQSKHETTTGKWINE